MNTEKREMVFDWNDEIVVGTLVTKDGKIVHKQIKELKKNPARKRKSVNKTKEKL